MSNQQNNLIENEKQINLGGAHDNDNTKNQQNEIKPMMASPPLPASKSPSNPPTLSINNNNNNQTRSPYVSATLTDNKFNDEHDDLFGKNDKTELITNNESSSSNDTDKINNLSSSSSSSSDESDLIKNDQNTNSNPYSKNFELLLTPPPPPPISNSAPSQQYLIQNQNILNHDKSQIQSKQHKVMKTSSSLLLSTNRQPKNNKFAQTVRPLRMWTVDPDKYKDITAKSWLNLYQRARHDLLSLLKSYGQINGVNFAHVFFDTCQRLFCLLADVNNAEQRNQFDSIMDGIPNDFRMIMNAYNKPTTSDFSQFKKVSMPNIEPKLIQWLCCVNCPQQIAEELKHFLTQGRQFKYYSCLQYMTNFCRTTFHEKRVFVTSMLAYMSVKLCQIIIISNENNESVALFNLFESSNEMFTDITFNPMKETMMLQENSSVRYVTNRTQNRTRKQPNVTSNHSSSSSSSSSSRSRTKKVPNATRTKKITNQQHLIGTTTDNRIKNQNQNINLQHRQSMSTQRENNDITAIDYVTNSEIITNDQDSDGKSSNTCVVQ
jgi:hypothetical protein